MVSDKECILILGMHRSGTSAIAGLIAQLNYDFGPSIVEPSFDNPKGFFENARVQQINDKILNILDVGWDYPGNLEDEWQNNVEIKKLEQEATEVIASEFQDASHIAIKDPRICLLLSFWQKLLIQSEYEIKTVIIVRNPQEVAMSLKKRNNISLNKSYLLYNTYLLNAEELSKSFPRAIISYHDLVANPKKTLQRINEKIDSVYFSTQLKEADVSSFIDKKLKHHSSKSTTKYPGLLPYMLDTFNTFDQLSKFKKPNKKSLDTLKKSREQHASYSKLFYEGVITSKKNIFKVFIDDGKGYNEKDTYSYPISSKMHSWDLNGISKYKKVDKLKFNPANTACIIKLKYLGIDLLKPTNYQIRSNAYLFEDDIYYFDTDYPEIIIDLEEKVGIEKLVTTIEYLVLGDAVVPAIKALDSKRLLSAKEEEIKSKDDVIKEREEHILSNDEEIVNLKKIISELKDVNDKTEKVLRASIEAELKDKEVISNSLNEALDAEKLDKHQLRSSMQAAIEAEKQDKLQLKQSLEDALKAEKKESAKVIKELEKAIIAEQKDKQKTEANLLQAVDAEKMEQLRLKEQVINEQRAILTNELAEKDKVIQSLQAAVSAEKEDKGRIKEELLKAIEAEKIDKANIKLSTLSEMQSEMEVRIAERNQVIQSLQAALYAEKEDKLKVVNSLHLAVASEKEDKVKVQSSTISEMRSTMEERLNERNQVIQTMQNALAAEKDDKQKVVASLQQAVQAEKEDKAIIKENFLKALEAERLELAKLKLSLQESKFLEMNDIKEKYDGLLKNSIIEKDQIIDALKERIEYELNERHNVVNSLRNAVNHEVLEREKVVNNLIISLEYEKRERDKMVQDITASSSYKLGRLITLPLRVPYNIFAHPDKSKVVLLMRFIGSGLRRPGKALASVNKQNFKTLKSALDRESPDEILKNYNRHLNKDKEQKAMAEIVRTQQNFFDATAISPPPTQNQISENKIIPVENLAITEITPQDPPINHDEMGFKEDRLKANILSSIKGSKILYISPNLPDYDTSSGGKRATRMLQLLAQECEVFSYARGARQQKYIDKLSSVGVTFIPEYDYDKIRATHTDFDVIIYAWYYTLHESNRFKELYPKAKIICDSVDIHWVREQRSLGLWEGLTQEKIDENKASEVAAYRQADVVWAVTEPDRQAVLKEIPNADVRVVSNIHDAHFTEYTPNKPNNMLFFGGFNHYPNISAAKLIVEKILPIIKTKVPDAQLIIAGANAPEEVIELGNTESVKFLGFIEEEDVEKLYLSSKLCVAPLLAGAGIKGKICESIAYMLPIVTNGIGNEGIQLVNKEDGLITEDFHEMANLIIEAFQGKHDLQSMAVNAQEKLFKLVGTSMVKENMLLSIPREVSICIVTWNRLNMLRDCINSIIENTMYPFYKILVYSNGCQDGTQEYLTQLAEKDVRIIPMLSKENEVFVIPNNKMMDRFPHNDAVLVNNDVTVELNWLNALVNAAYKNRHIGISGSKILYPDGTLQEFGSELYEDGTGRNIGKWDENPYKEEYSYMRYVGYVSGCSLYLKRTTLKRIGKFDEQFHPCYCEDSDLCYTAWENDIHVVVTPHSIINHFEGGTSGKDEGSGFKSYQKVNFEKFLSKHKANLTQVKKKIAMLNS